MPNVQAPGVYVTVNDQSQYIPATSGTVLGLVGSATKGPLNTPVLIGDAGSLVSTFGLPSAPNGTGTTYYNALLSALQYLNQGSSLYFVRAGSGAANASASIANWTAGSSATATAEISGFISGITVGAGGTGYPNTTTVVLTGGGGTGATATATVAAGVITAVNIVNPGTGYTSAPTVSFANVGSGTGATATATISASVTSITISSPGSGYTSVPYVTISAPSSGTTATAYATISAGEVSTIQVTYGGDGYTTAPTVTVESGYVAALTPGTDGNNISYSISPGTSTVPNQTFKLTVSYTNPFTEVTSIVETFDNLPLTGDPTTFVNGISQYINLYPGNATMSNAPESATLSGGTNGTVTDASLIGTVNGVYVTGLQNFLNTNNYEIDMVAIPESQSAAVVAALLTLVTSRQDCIALIDTPDYLSPQQVAAWASGQTVTVGSNNYSIAEPNQQFSAIYWPWVQVFDAYSNTYTFIPPSGSVAGVYAYIDENYYPWFAPAGPKNGVISSAVNVRYNCTNADRAFLASNLNSINPIVNSSVYGLTVMDQVTTYREYSDLHNVNVARLIANLIRTFKQSLQVFEFYPDDSFTWASVASNINQYLAFIQSNRGLYSFNTVCDATNNTPLNQANGQLNVTVQLQPTKPARTINVALSLVNSAVTATIA